jgi:hypothetical protein
MVDVLVIHLAVPTYVCLLAATAPASTAVAHRDAAKRTQCSRHSVVGYCFVPLTMETSEDWASPLWVYCPDWGTLLC